MRKCGVIFMSKNALFTLKIKNMSSVYAIAKIVKVKNNHYDSISNTAYYTGVIQKLQEEGFQLFERSKDDSYESYSHPNFKNDNIYTLVYFDTTGHIIDLQLCKIKED